MNGLGRLSSLSLLASQKTTVHSLQRCLSLLSTSQNCRSTFSTLPSSIFRPLGQISGFLKPVSVVNTAPAVAGLKHVANPRRRCKHCWATIKVKASLFILTVLFLNNACSPKWLYLYDIIRAIYEIEGLVIWD